MLDKEDFDLCVDDAIGDDVGRARNDQLGRALDLARTAYEGLADKSRSVFEWISLTMRAAARGLCSAM